MAINFPSNPTVGDTFTANNTVFTWNGESWSLTQQTFNTTSQDYGSNTINVDIDIANGNNARIDLDTNVGSRLRLQNIPQNKSSKLSITMERNGNIGEMDIDTSVYSGSTNLYSEFLENSVDQIFFSPDGTKIFLVDNIGQIQSGALSEPWNLNTIDKVASISAISGVNGLYISNDGLHAYLTNNTQFVYHVILSTAWDITSGNFVTPDESYDASVQGTNLQSVYFRDDGSSSAGKTMFLLSDSEDKIFQYSLNTAWVFSDGSPTPLSYVFQELSVATEDSFPTQIYIRQSDGLKLYVFGVTTDSVYMYDLNSAWNILGSAGSDDSYNFSSISTTGVSIFFNPDGTEMYYAESSDERIHKYTITDWTVSSASYSGYYSMNKHMETVNGFFVSKDGTRMYVVSSDDDMVHYYVLNTPWDITSARYQHKEFYIGSEELTPSAIYVSPDGNYFYIVGTNSDRVRMYIMSTPWDITTASYVDYAYIGTQEPNAYALWFSSDGLNFYILGSGETVYQYVLDTPWTLGNKNLTNTYSRALGTGYGESLYGISFTEDGRHMFIMDQTLKRVSQFRLSTPFQVNTASFTGKTIEFGGIGGTLFSDICVSPDGEHLYLCDYNTDRVYQYDIDYGEWDLENYSSDGITFDPATKAGDGDVIAFRWGKDGFRLYVLGNTSPIILQYNCDIQYDLSSISASGPSGFLNVGLQDSNASGFMFNEDGTILYAIGSTNGTISQYDLDIAWELGFDSGGESYSEITVTLPNPADYNGEAIYTTPGTYNWTCPSGVTSVIAVCIGGGGGGVAGNGYYARAGGGGGLGWKNDIPVTPGQSYTVVVGAGGAGVYLSNTSNPGGDSYFINNTTVLGEGANRETGGGHIGDGGGNGGNGGYSTSNIYSSGGGGTGGYLGNGGNGDYYTGQGTDGTGGAGGGAGGSTEGGAGGIGGGVGIYGIGNSGSAGAYPAGNGGNGSINVSNGTLASTVFGYGARSDDRNVNGETNGGNGAVRIVWGRGKTYPSNAYFADTDVNYTIDPYTKIQFKPDGTRLYVMGTYDNTIVEYVLNTAWDLSSIDNSQTAVFQKHFIVEVNERNLTTFYINPLGDKLFIYGLDNDDIFQFTMSTPWDITTASYDGKAFTAVPDIPLADIGFDYSGAKMYMLSDNNNDVYQYTIATYSPTIIWPVDINWENNSPPQIPARGSSTIVELYVSDNGNRIYGLEKIKNSDNTQ